MLKTRAQKVRIEFKFSKQILTCVLRGLVCNNSCIFFALTEIRVVGILLLPYDCEKFEHVSDWLIMGGGVTQKNPIPV